MVEALDIHVKGIVQGVGFRPFVYRLAKRYLIHGWVLNATDGVHIHAEGEEKLLDEFVLELSEHAPAAAQVTEIELREVPLEPFDDFEIRFSEDEPGEESTFVSPDLALCEDCARELFDPKDRRFRYPFINCTNCGPRFTIIEELPYDRPKTSMAKFTMCPACQEEYEDPADRRFHAQPNACFQCGPSLSFYRKIEKDGAADASDEPIGAPGVPSDLMKRTVTAGALTYECTTAQEQEGSDAILAQAVALLLAGNIIAVKGLGGFHLVCDGNNETALAQLRERKHREGKAFAVMMDSLEDVKMLCHVGAEEEAVLGGAVRPIVLLRKRSDVTFALGLADKLPELGVMLPYTPLQHLLVRDFAEAYRGSMDESVSDGFAAAAIPLLVMTSGNVHDEPIVIDDEEALERLGGIADAILGNDREILTRFDDSVVRVIRAGSAGESVQLIRRARGYAPTPIAFSLTAQGEEMEDSVLFATGPEQKNTFAFTRAGESFVSQYIGDMENADTFAAWLEAKGRYERLFRFEATELVCDRHPEYLTTKWAHEQSALRRPPLPLMEVQHHHSHIVAAMAENGLDEAVCGIAFDGTGYGMDGNIWGGEVLISNLSDFERFANFAYVPLPGGAAAIKHPLQAAFGVLWEFDLLDHPAAQEALSSLGQMQLGNLETMVEQGINTVVTSSVGRLFDAASALLGLCTEPTYDGEAAILLEAELWRGLTNADASAQERGASASDAKEGHGEAAYRIDVVKNTATDESTAHDTSVVLLDAAPTFKALLDDKEAGVPLSQISRRFHDSFVEAIVQAAQLVQALYGITTVVLSGGVFMNRYVIEQALERLEQAGFTIAINRELPPNDGCVSFGQSVVAWSKKTIEQEAEKEE